MKQMNGELTWVMLRWTAWFVEFVDSKMVVKISSRSRCCGDQTFMVVNALR
jgi:hypothetical protein